MSLRTEEATLLFLDEAGFAERYNKVPFGFTHDLHRLDLFSEDSLAALCRAYADHPQDYFVAQSAPDPATIFYSVPRTPLRPHEALPQLTAGSYRILLKRLEDHDPRFADLLRALFDRVKTHLKRDGYCGEVIRLESSIFISAPWCTTPFHFDPEINFFTQIEGEKTYRLYAPGDLREDEVEPLYVRGTVDIGQIDLGARNRAQEYVFALRPGMGVHQPQDSPHWVQTMGARSVSYTFVYETPEGRSRARVRAFNHYLRRLRVAPTQPGANPMRDTIKAAAMAAALPIRKSLGRLMRGPASR